MATKRHISWTRDKDDLVEKMWLEGIAANKPPHQIDCDIGAVIGKTPFAIRQRRVIMGFVMNPGNYTPTNQPARLTPVWFPAFEDMAREVIEREWPTGRPWNWQRLRQQVKYSLMGCAGAMCAASRSGQ